MPDAESFGGEAGEPPANSGDEEALRTRMKRDLQRYLRIRERSEAEVRRYLQRRGFPERLRRAALRELRTSGLVDDHRFAEMFLRDRRRLRPMSRAAVRRELRGRGIARELADAVLAKCDPPWDDAELAAELLASRWDRWAPDTRRTRAQRLLTRRGFGPGLIRSAIAAREASADIDDREAATG